MRRAFTLALSCACTIGISLLAAHVHPFGDAGLYASNTTRAAIMERSSVPPKVRATLIAKCADCHSASTRAPLYGRFAPVSWLMERDIITGREKMNLALWDTYSPDKQQTLAAQIVEETRTRDMPLPQYRMIHRSTRVTDAEVLDFIRWERQISAPAAIDANQSAATGDPVRGQAVFERRCAGCHAEGREGPSLRGVFGRKAASLSGYEYSSALKNANFVWNEASLDRWLTDPDVLVPGNNMGFRVANPQDRLDLIRFLKELSTK